VGRLNKILFYAGSIHSRFLLSSGALRTAISLVGNNIANKSLSGLVLSRAGRLVEEGESVTYDGINFVAETVENNRILEVRVEIPESSDMAVDISAGNGSEAASDEHTSGDDREQ
jgi:hypothetical protein